MGIAPYKTFTFGGVSSSAYDVYLTGEGVFNAPERAVDILEIPGRNGAYALDQGRFKNIEVTYKAGIYDLNEANFATKVANLRNWLCSHVGYVRLEDDYNTGEYRMAIYKSGLDVEHEGLINGEFDLTFECKPQRWLTSGETASTVANNGTLSNPTLFESSPLLAVKGYGGIHFNGFDIVIQNIVLGNIVIADNDTISPVSYYDPNYPNAYCYKQTYTFNTGSLNNGDVIDVSGVVVSRLWFSNSNNPTSTTQSDTNASFQTSQVVWDTTFNSKDAYPETTFNIQLTAGTNSVVTNTLTVNVSHSNYTVTYSVIQTVTYDAVAGTITLDCKNEATKTGTATGLIYRSDSFKNINIIGHSTVSALGNPTYIDCDIGECYMIKNSNIVSLNGVISLGSQLPTLASGTNTFTYDNTITELKVTPRWWQV